MPAPLTHVDEDAACGLAGPGGDVFRVPGATVVVGPLSVVIVADPGDDPDVSGVWNDREFRLVGPAPVPVASRTSWSAPGLVATVSPSGDEGKLDVWVGARHRGAPHPLGLLDLPWRGFDG